MANSSDYRTGRHGVFTLHVHVVLVAKSRRLVFTPEILEDLRTILSTVCQDFEATWEEFDGERDHGHLRVTSPLKWRFPDGNSLKRISSRLIHKKHDPTIERALWGQPLVPELFCRFRWRGAPIDHQTIHRATGDPELTPTESAPHIPALNGGVLRRV
ncbi:transposase IS200-family protein [Sulfobacillus acidophilus DSM 10332]|uniref:Transposase IS200-family protein n=1 Tax=Sulfobacillus acidophilus (strain ATCC 700253 / DSM 10332 / NAL) TaxID=679936 RepID=G8TTI6_SULAD|nr:transposase IS200-family protein [Sulfobacillus acidophilus DSM 10332]